MPAPRSPGAIPALHRQLCGLLPRLAGEVFSGAFETEGKGGSGLDFVTSIDLAMQARLETGLAALLPGSRVAGEEGFAGLSGSAPCWLVDPLDGTVNFVAGLPAYAVAAVLIEDGAPVLAAVHDVTNAATYSAIAGQGAFVNGTPLQRRETPARLAIVSSGLLAEMAARCPQRLEELLQRCKLRNFGSQALHLCYAAAGHVSLVASREAKGWDDMAGALIAREAGLAYGSYAPGADLRAADQDQLSLCTAPDDFAAHAALFAASLPEAAPDTRTDQP
jgi:myo-inositol-1(or 4)-monophosphatase